LKELNQLTAEFDVPGLFCACPATSGQVTPAWAATAASSSLRRSLYPSLIAHPGQGHTSTEAIYTADGCSPRLKAGRMVIAHVGGRYADLKYAHDGRLERAVGAFNLGQFR
jgi:hypothetical protein